MATDIYGREIKFGGAVNAKNVSLTGAGLASEGAEGGFIIQSIDIQYQQAINRIYALEDGRIYFISGPTNGAFAGQNVVGPKGFMKTFLEKYGNVCNYSDPGVITLRATPCQTTSAQSGTVKLDHVMVQSFGIRAQSSDMILFGSFQSTFLSLSLEQ
jgi:hypothetical protein